MVATQIKYDCDIVTVDFIEQHSNFEQVVFQPSYLDAEDMVCTLLARKAPVCIWGRLIRTSLYRDNAIKPLANINCGEDYQVTARLAYYAHSVKKYTRNFYTIIIVLMNNLIHINIHVHDFYRTGRV